MPKQEWHLETDSGIMEAPVGTDDSIYFSTERAAYAADASDGTIRWKYDDGFGDVSLRIVGVGPDCVYLSVWRIPRYVDTGTDETKELHAIDKATGTTNWTYVRERGDLSDIEFMGTVYDGNVYLCAPRDTHSYNLYVPTATSGPVMGLEDGLLASLGDMPTIPPCVTDERVSVGTTGGNIEFFAPVSDEVDIPLEDWGLYDLPDDSPPRALVWQDEMLFVGSDESVHAVAGVLEPEIPWADWSVSVQDPVRLLRVTNHMLYAGTGSGVVAINLDDGTVEWSAGTADVHELFLADDIVYTALGGSIFALDADSGRQLWTLEADAREMRCVSPGLHDRIYAVAYQDIGVELYEIDATDGTEYERMELESGDYRNPAPLVVDERLYLGLHDGLHAFATTRPTQASDSSAPSETCPSCGQSLTGDEAFCPECGEDLSSVVSTCPECSADLDGDESFCPECGHDLSSVVSACPECGADLEGDEAFCPECGHALGGERR